MTTSEKNNLIAEFMGFINTTPNDKDFNIYQNSEGKLIETMSMEYNSNWIWLMGVVEKIEDFYIINGEEIEFRVVQYEDEVLVVAKYQLKRWENIIEILSDGSGKFNNTYEAIVQFIIWFNKNK